MKSIDDILASHKVIVISRTHDGFNGYSYHNSGGVLWDWYCSQFEADKEEEEC